LDLENIRVGLPIKSQIYDPGGVELVLCQSKIFDL